MLSAIPALTTLNDLSITEPSSPINIMAPFINVTASLINIIASPIKVTATVNYGKDLTTLAKMYTEESKYNKKNNNFNYKLVIFNNFYSRVNIL